MKISLEIDNEKAVGALIGIVIVLATLVVNYFKGIHKRNKR